MSDINRKLKTGIVIAGVIIFLWVALITSILIATTPETVIYAPANQTGPTLTLPPGFTAKPESFNNGEIEYHLNLSGSDNKVRGYFQIIFMGTDLEEYLATAEKYKAADIDTFVKYNGDRPGSVIWEYTTQKSNVLYFFIKKEQRLYVLTLSADKNLVSMDKLKEYFTETLKGLVI